MEVDLVAAAFQIYIFAVCGQLTFQGKNASEWRNEIFAALKTASPFFTAEAVKHLVLVFLNTSADKVITTIKAKTLFPPPNVVQLFRQLELLRPNLLPTARGFGFNDEQSEEHKTSITSRLSSWNNCMFDASLQSSAAT